MQGDNVPEQRLFVQTQQAADRESSLDFIEMEEGERSVRKSNSKKCHAEKAEDSGRQPGRQMPERAGVHPRQNAGRCVRAGVQGGIMPNQFFNNNAKCQLFRNSVVFKDFYML